MFETFEDILNSHIYIPPTFSGIAICEVDYIITSITKNMDISNSDLNSYLPPKYEYDISFKVIGANAQLSNEKWK